VTCGVKRLAMTCGAIATGVLVAASSASAETTTIYVGPPEREWDVVQVGGLFAIFVGLIGAGLVVYRLYGPPPKTKARSHKGG
jgi:hypothetical protein